MAKNYVQEGRILNLAIADKSAGDPVAVGQITGVCLTDTDSDGMVRVQVTGVFDLSVTGKDSSDENVSISEGEEIFLDSGELNKDDTNGVSFGYALGAVSSGASTTIPVRLKL